MRKNILVVLGSTRYGREGAKVANLAVKQLKAVGLEPILVGKDSSMIGFENKLNPYFCRSFGHWRPCASPGHPLPPP